MKKRCSRMILALVSPKKRRVACMGAEVTNERPNNSRMINFRIALGWSSVRMLISLILCIKTSSIT